MQKRKKVKKKYQQTKLSQIEYSHYCGAPCSLEHGTICQECLEMTAIDWPPPIEPRRIQDSI